MGRFKWFAWGALVLGTIIWTFCVLIACVFLFQSVRPLPPEFWFLLASEAALLVIMTYIGVRLRRTER